MRYTFMLVLSVALSFVIIVPAVHSAPKSVNGKPFVIINDQLTEVINAVELSLQGQIDQIRGDVETIEDFLSANESAILRFSELNEDIQILINSGVTDSVVSIQAEIVFLTGVVGELKASIAANEGDITLNQEKLAANENMISQLASALANVESGAISLGASLQDQIDNNAYLIKTLEDEMVEIQADLDRKQNLINGICADGSSVQQVLVDGSVICGAAGGSGGNFQTVLSFYGEYRNPNEDIDIVATCPVGFTVISAGVAHAKGWDIINLRPTGPMEDSPNGSWLNAKNMNAYRTWISSAATCMRLVP